MGVLVVPAAPSPQVYWRMAGAGLSQLPSGHANAFKPVPSPRKLYPDRRPD